MNYKPDEATMMSYLYGELEPAEQKKVEEYLQQNPDEKKRIEEWSFTRSVFAGLEDKEVIAPPIITTDNTRPFWKENYFRMPLGIAASLMLFLVVAKLIGLSLTYSPGEFKVAFGEKVEKVESVQIPTLTEQQVGEMIRTSLAMNNETIKESWAADRKDFQKAIQGNLNKNSNKIDKLMQTASAANQEQVKQFVAQIQNDNLKLMKDYMQLSATGQKEYIESLLVDFSKYLNEQRKQDLQILQAKVNKVEQNTDIFKQETEQILTSLISTSKTNTLRRN